MALTDAAYHVNWTPLTNSSKKALIMIMMRTNRPILLSGSSVIIMSIETFMKVCMLFFYNRFIFKATLNLYCRIFAIIY